MLGLYSLWGYEANLDSKIITKRRFLKVFIIARIKENWCFDRIWEYSFLDYNTDTIKQKVKIACLN
jgi:hypothetical protein